MVRLRAGLTGSVSSNYHVPVRTVRHSCVLTLVGCSGYDRVVSYLGSWQMVRHVCLPLSKRLFYAHSSPALAPGLSEALLSEGPQALGPFLPSTISLPSILPKVVAAGADGVSDPLATSRSTLVLLGEL